MKNLKQLSIFVGVVIIHQLLTNFIYSNLYPIHFADKNFFVLELIDKTLNMQNILIFFFDMGILILLWLIGKKVFSSRFSVLPPIIYTISLWSSYLVSAGSFYIYLSFLILLIFYGLLLIKSNQRFWGTALVIGATSIATYSSLFLMLLLPVMLILIVVFKITPVNELRLSIPAVIILILPLVFLIYNNQSGFKNILSNEVQIFADPGLMNTVNSYQGAAKQKGLGLLARISENKYLFSVEYVILKFTKQITPPTYFTPQEKLLNFSFTPPIFLGLLVPFLFSLYQILKSSFLRRNLFLSSLLVIPSVFSKQMVDLNRLIIFMPVVTLIISYGFIKLYEQGKDKEKAFLILTLFLVTFQLLVTLSDINLRERSRFIKYHSQDYEIGNQ